MMFVVVVVEDESSPLHYIDMHTHVQYIQLLLNTQAQSKCKSTMQMSG